MATPLASSAAGTVTIQPTRGDDRAELAGQATLDSQIDVQPQPLGMHLEELARRLMGPTLLIGIVSLLAFMVADNLLARLLTHLDLNDVELHVYSPTELMMVKIKLSVVVALVVGFPSVLWALYLFSTPGLYEHERRFARWIIPTSLVLFLLGSLLALLVMAPLVIGVMLRQVEHSPAEMAMSLEGTLNPVFTLVLGLGLALQMPLVLGLAFKLKLISPAATARYRTYIYGLFILLSLVLAPDPSLLAQLMVMGVLVLLFELTLAVGRRKDWGADEGPGDTGEASSKGPALN